MAIILDAKNRQIIKGQVKAEVKITRYISSIAMPVNCLLVDGTYVGSCIYNDFCGYIKNILSLNENNCPQNLIDNGIPCTCPFNLPIKEININESLLLPNLSNPLNPNPWLGSFFQICLASGDIDVTIKLTIGTSNILCLNMKYAIKPI